MNEQNYISTKKAAELLQMTTRRVIGLCNDGKLEGALREGRSWKIPEASVISYQIAYEHSRRKRRVEPEKKLPCAVGITSFTELAANSYYVDKTLLIRDLLDHRNSVTLFTRPRRFGKTLAINMLKTFFEKTEEDTSGYFRDKKIWQCGERYQEQQGKYPVIFLTFKDVKLNTWSDSMETMKIVIRDEYMRHPELLASEALDSVDRQYLEGVRTRSLSDVEWMRSLLNLSRMLEKHHHQKAVILIDEYDTPIQQGHMKGFYEEVITFMRNLMSGGLKDNPFMAFGVLTGILRVSKENLFSGLNHLVVDTVLDEKYSEYFGFTKAEVLDMAGYYGCLDRMEEIRTWYDGYRFGKTEIYNPWSVTNYFYNDCKPKAFWANTSDNLIMQEILDGLSPEMAEELFRLLQGETVETSLNMEVIYPHISDGADTIFSFLLIAGYLKPVSEAVETEFGTFVSVELPNREIYRVYNMEILSWLRGITRGNTVAELEKALYMNQGDKLQGALRNFMVSCISCFDGAAEGFYHGMMLGLTASLSSRYLIRSNRESGDGRFDLILEPKMKSFPGIIMEFKAVKAGEKDKLAKLAAEGLIQIRDNKYDIDMKERGINRIVKYGIAFSGKQVEVCFEG